MADDVMQVSAVDRQLFVKCLSTLWLAFLWAQATMASRAGLIDIDAVLEQMDSDEWMAEGSDDDLGMEDYYDSDSSGEGIILE